MTPHSRFLQHALSADDASACWTLPGGLSARWLAPGCVQIAPPGGEADSVLLSCGVHGNETAPIEVVDAILGDIDAGRLTPRCRLLVMFANPDAIRAGVRYQHYDMNRLFNGAHAREPQLPEARRAAELETLAAAFFAEAAGRRLHYDLHTAIRGSAFEKFAIYPYLHQRAHNREQLAWLQQCGIEAVLLHSQPANTFSYHTSRHCEADAFTLELGKARPFGENELPRFAGIDRALRRLLAEPRAEIAPLREDGLPLFRAKYDLLKHSEAFRLHLADDVQNFTLLADGMLIADDGDVRYVASGGDERILFPNPTVKPGLRAGIVVEPARLD
ncbi:succinylglutamate desuccinylase [Chromobacterium sp. ATCC 53434]|uniref:succinylglutamate desuccinylase n=1 Tax=Chromobacterium sp. (strain ATCC 53434 / SC 14030) TaxID=2059672 RepID=UPI000C760629|nr:succinylglutamate desuccinylase [Chromobacterium sp. ATCC 53434]AUH50595.1 succinylglutamate desuccinylase [Chromobacterium sp. ATCC 53434]